ncbi:MAG: hypothetical protein ACI4JK_03760 [Oscillospiraceae bacterium]
MEEKKRISISSLVLGIVGTVFAFFIPAVTYGCSIPGLVRGVKKRKIKNCTAGITLNIVALAIAVFNSLAGILVTLKVYGSEKSDESSCGEE